MRFPKNIFLAAAIVLTFGAMAFSQQAPASGQDGKSGQSGQSGAGQQGGASGQASSGPTVSAQERQDYQALVSEASAGLNANKVISLSEDYVKKYPTSPMLSTIYAFEVLAYRQNGDLPKVIDAGEKSLKLNGDNLVSLITLALVLPQPDVMKGNDLDKEKKLAEAESDANHALEIIGKLQKSPEETDDQFKKRIGEISSDPHSALGLVHLQRSTMVSLTGGMDPDELNKAAKEYQEAVSVTDRPQPEDYYRLGEVYGHLDKLDDAIAAFSKSSEIGHGQPIQASADAQVENLKKKKADAKPPAKP